MVNMFEFFQKKKWDAINKVQVSMGTVLACDEKSIQFIEALPNVSPEVYTLAVTTMNEMTRHSDDTVVNLIKNTLIGLDSDVTVDKKDQDVVRNGLNIAYTELTDDEQLKVQRTLDSVTKMDKYDWAAVLRFVEVSETEMIEGAYGKDIILSYMRESAGTNVNH